jgi:hypothetical protein
MIQAGDETLLYQIRKHTNSIWINNELPNQRKELIIVKI